MTMSVRVVEPDARVVRLLWLFPMVVAG